MKPKLFLWIASLALAIYAGPAAAQTQGAPPDDPALIEKIRKSNDECYSCHTERGLKNPPRQDMDMKKLAGLLVDPKVFDNSNHTGMECKACHGQAYAVFPHKENARQLISPCGECHARKVFIIEKEYEKSVHQTELPGKFTCQSCHDPHVYKVAAKIGAPRQIVKQDNQMCFDCHENELLFSKFVDNKKKLPNLDDIHKWLPNQKLHWEAVRCIDCHTPVAKKTMSHEILKKDKAEKNCVACHSVESSLRTRLYRHLVKEDRLDKAGFVNSFILTDAYVVGATRNEYLDKAFMAIAALTALGVLGHGFIRLLGGAWRRGRRH